MCRAQSVLLVALFIGLAIAYPWDIVVARYNKLEFYNGGTLAHTATPATHLIKWITYDPVHDRVLFAEKYNRKDSASSFDIANQTTQSLIKKKTNQYLSRFAYDPATELLFGTVKKIIYSFPLGPGNNNDVNGYLVITLETTPHEIAVDSCRGFIYWTAYNVIERALFNGSEREVIIDNMDNVTVRQGLTVDSQKIYWIENQDYNDGAFSIESADLDGNNRRTLFRETESESSPEKLTVSKDFISWEDSIEKFFWQLPKNPPSETDVKPNKIAMNTTIPCCGSHDIASNYKIEERTQDVPNCNALKSLLPVCFNSSVFCVHGTKVIGKSRCDCTQGYIGTRCDVSVCENYCSQGACNLSDGGQPTCRCSAGYTGERCDVAICANYCFKGDCNVNSEGQPQCRCNAGYSGVRCDISVCHKHCLNNGICSLNEEDEPICQCTGQYEGERCDVPIPKAERFHWLPLINGQMPPGAIIGGFEGENTYIARAYHFNELCPGKYIRETNTAFFPWSGKQYTKEHFEILCGFNAKWVKTSYGNIPKNAFVGGHSVSPIEFAVVPLYICRDKIDGKLIVGKVYLPHKKCYLPYYSQERETTSYEILVEE